jgi:hypothetical protein
MKVDGLAGDFNSSAADDSKAKGSIMEVLAMHISQPI